MGKSSPATAVWRGSTVLLRIALAGCVLVALASAAANSFGEAILFGASALCLFGLQKFTNRQALGYFVDAQGERQKIDRMDGEHIVYRPTSRSSRVIDEAVEKEGRWGFLIGGGIFGAILSYTAWYAFTQTPPGSTWKVGGVMAGAVAAIVVVTWIATLLQELVYQSGFQDIKGAKVLDPAPASPGLAEVVAQKTHGDARYATEEEAHELLSGDV